MRLIVSLRNILLVFRKDFTSSLYSPVAYLVLISFLVFSAAWLFFLQNFFARDTASLRIYFDIFPVLFAVLIPAATMRCWAEEFRLGTAEILFSFPAYESELVIGKFLAAYSVILLAVLISVSVPVSLVTFGNFDHGQIRTAYFGVILFTAMYTAFACLVSSLSKNQVSSFLISAAVLLSLNFIDHALIFSNMPDFFRSLIRSVSLSHRFADFNKGVIDSRDVAFFLTSTTAFLYLNVQILFLRKWR
ncbi:ABC transporter permease subunit [Spirochaeta dissipatitropha]